MFRGIIIAFIFVICSAFSTETIRPKAEVAFVLDLSGSTNGLLDDVRDNMWHFINYFNKANPEIDLKIGVVGFSRGSFGLENHYVRIISDLSMNYDFVSHELFNLVSCVEKGDQYVGAALKTTVGSLSWSQDPLTKKIIILFGNSRADLGRVDYNYAVEQAVEKKIVINSVYCTNLNPNPKDIPAWNSIADRTGGELYKIQLTKRTSLKARTQAVEDIIELNNNLNETYIPYTHDGSLKHNLMLVADINSLQMSQQFFVSRCVTKASAAYLQYLNSFDLVNYVKLNNRLPEYNRKYFPDQLAKINDKDLYELAVIKMQRREKLLVRLNESLVEVNADSLAVNPIDSVFINSISKHL